MSRPRKNSFGAVPQSSPEPSSGTANPAFHDVLTPSPEAKQSGSEAGARRSSAKAHPFGKKSEKEPEDAIDWAPTTPGHAVHGDESDSDEARTPTHQETARVPETPLGPGDSEEDAIRTGLARCRECIYEEEVFVNAWPVISINQWDVEQERILILTDKAYYRVKYSFVKKEIIRFDRTGLHDIRAIQKGNFYSSLTGSRCGANSYAMRVFVGEDRTSPFAKKQYYRTYCVAPGPNVQAGQQQKDLTEKMVGEFLRHRRRMVGGENFYVSENEMVRAKPLGPVSVMMNQFKLGYFKKMQGHKKKDEKNQLLSS